MEKRTVYLLLLAPVVLKVHMAIHRINRYPMYSVAIYPMDSVIQSLNNRGLKDYNVLSDNICQTYATCFIDIFNLENGNLTYYIIYSDSYNLARNFFRFWK